MDLDRTRVLELRLPSPASETETLFSICARYHRLSGRSDSKSTAVELLGHRRASSLHDFPVGLGHLEQVSGGAIRPTLELLRQRTVLAAVWPFTDRGWQDKVLRQSTLAPTKGVQQAPGMRWNALPNRIFLRHCRDCLDEDLRKGVPVWRNEQQWPGMWACLRHSAPLASLDLRAGSNEWALPSEPASTRRSHDLSKESLTILLNLARAVVWLSSKKTLSVPALGVLVRSRLAQTGFAITDITTTSADLNRFNELRVLRLVATGAAHFVSLPHDARWIREVLVDRRASHPTKWAILLSSSGPCDSVSLDAEYAEAAGRVTVHGLTGIPAARRSRAPQRLYEALRFHHLLADACKACDMTRDEAERWVRRDKALHEMWREAKLARRKAESRLAVLAFREANPNALRSDYFQKCGPHARWLQLNDKSWIEANLPTGAAYLSPQRRLDL
ncbi:hypothetical protein [Rhizobacter sp. P5_C2]